MKKLLLIPLILLITISLTACSDRPFNGPAGTMHVSSDKLTYYYSNEVENKKIFEFEFTQELNFFEGPFAQNYDFRQLDHYEIVSDNFIQFLDSFDYIYYDIEETDEDYDNLELSVGATENDHNLVEVPVDDKVKHIDAYILDPSGIRIIFSYTEFESDGTRIVVPYHIAFLAYELLVPNKVETVTGDNSPNKNELFKVEYSSYLIPIPPQMRFERDTYSNEVITEESYIKYFTKDSDQLLCGDTSLVTCYNNLHVVPNIYAQNTTTIELTNMFIDLFNGRIEGTNFVVTVNEIDLTIQYEEINGEILVKYNIFTR